MRNLALLFILALLQGCEKSIPASSVNVFYEQIPGSKNHSPNGAWWGYNQSKIVRFENTVYMYVIDNQNIDINQNPNATNPSKIVLYRKEGNGNWQKGSSFNTSRPGNILIDSEGVVHLIVFEPTYTQPSENGSFGKLVHYWFPDSGTGDITGFQQETIVDNDGVSQGETVNIRVGASIGKADMMAVSFGLNKKHQIYYKEKNSATWVMNYAAQNLNSDLYYPYLLVTDSGFGILAIQDDYVGVNLPNIYQKSYYFEKINNSWTEETIVDLSSHSLAQSRPQLVENSDIFQDENKQIHLLYQTRLDPSDSFRDTFNHSVKNSSGWVNETVTSSDKSTNWMRLIEVDGEIYYLCSTWDKLYIKKGATGAFSRLKVPSVSGMYVYVSSPRGGTGSGAQYIDILLLCGNSSAYPGAGNYYVRIEKSELSKVL